MASHFLLKMEVKLSNWRTTFQMNHNFKKFCAAGLMFGLVGFKSQFWKKFVGGGGVPLIFFIHILSS